MFGGAGLGAHRAPCSPDQGDARPAALEREKALRHCNINLPDGSCRPVPIRPGVSIRELLLGLCQTLRINLAAVDLFLVGGEKVRLRLRQTRPRTLRLRQTSPERRGGAVEERAATAG